MAKAGRGGGVGGAFLEKGTPESYHVAAGVSDTGLK